MVVGSDGEDADEDHRQPPSPTGSTYSKRSTVPDNHSRKPNGGKATRQSKARQVCQEGCTWTSSVKRQAPILTAPHLRLCWYMLDLAAEGMIRGCRDA